MSRALRRVDESDVPRGRQHVGRGADSRERVAVEPVAWALLRLQRSAGNRAVSTALARETSRTAARKEDGDRDADGGPVNTTLIMPDPIGVLPLESFSFNDRAGEIDVVVPATAMDSTLFLYASSGQILASVTISTRGFTLTLTDVLVSSMQAGGSMLRFALNGKNVVKGPPATSEPKKPD
jgi:hypothetical protein